MANTTPTLSRKLRSRPGNDSDTFRTPTMKRVKHNPQPLTPGASPAFEIPPSPCLRQLGYGTGIKVLLYERSPRSNGPRSPWAIKKLSKGCSSRDAKQIASRLEHEAKIMKTFNHPNIIGYRGFKRNPDGSRVLALETGKQCCSLYDILEKTRDDVDEELEPMPAEKILFVAKEVAKALDYLHKEKRILHGDLKAANVLIIGDFDAVKICDFGVTVPLDKDGKADPKHQYVGTEPWSAREVVEEIYQDISDKADIYALGCTIFEMLAMDTPHADKLPPLDASIEGDRDASYDTTEYQESMGSRPNLPDYFDFDESYETALGIFYACTDEDPKKRPSAKRLVELLCDETNENTPDN